MKLLILVFCFIMAVSLKAQDTVKFENLEIRNGIFYLKNKAFSGIAITFHNNGIKESTTTIRDGKKAGKIETFYDSGKLKMVSYENEHFQNYGETHVWNEDGSEVFKGFWKDNKLFETDKNEPYSGTITTTFENGKINSKDEFKNGQWNGTQTIYDRNGIMISECIFKNNNIVDCKNLKTKKH